MLGWTLNSFKYRIKSERLGEEDGRALSKCAECSKLKVTQAMEIQRLRRRWIDVDDVVNLFQSYESLKHVVNRLSKSFYLMLIGLS